MLFLIRNPPSFWLLCNKVTAILVDLLYKTSVRPTWMKYYWIKLLKQQHQQQQQQLCLNLVETGTREEKNTHVLQN